MVLKMYACVYVMYVHVFVFLQVIAGRYIYAIVVRIAILR